MDISMFERIGNVPFFYKSLITGNANAINISIAVDEPTETFTFNLTNEVMINGQSIFEVNHPLHESFTFTITQNDSNLTYSNSSIIIDQADYNEGVYEYKLVLTHKGREYSFENQIEVVITE